MEGSDLFFRAEEEKGMKNSISIGRWFSLPKGHNRGGRRKSHQPARKACFTRSQRVPRTFSPHGVIDTFGHAVLDASPAARHG